MAALVRLIPGSVGYVELAYAKRGGLATAAVRNRSGKFVLSELAAVSAAAETAKVPDDLRFSVVNAAGARAYPWSRRPGCWCTGSSAIRIGRGG